MEKDCFCQRLIITWWFSDSSGGDFAFDMDEIQALEGSSGSSG